jgi:hypothetical protein
MIETEHQKFDRHVDDWVCYLVGAILVLMYKWGRYIRQRRAQGIGMKQATIEWFFEPSADNVTSWVVTVGFIWTFGTVYIFKIDIGLGEWFQRLPVMCPFAFLFGGLLELYAPAAARWLMSKLPWGNQS